MGQAVSAPKAALRRAATLAGGMVTTTLNEEDADYLAVNSAFDNAEIRALWKLFHEVDKDDSGHISQEELMGLPQLAFNPLAQRVVKYAFDKREMLQADIKKQQQAFGDLGVAAAPAGSSSSRPNTAASADLSFKDFVAVLSPFAANATLDDKLRLAFAVYDFDGDGKLGEEDLMELLRQLLPEGTETELLESVVEQAMLEADKDQDGFLDLREFKKAVDKDDFKAKLTMIFEV